MAQVLSPLTEALDGSPIYAEDSCFGKTVSVSEKLRLESRRPDCVFLGARLGPLHVFLS